MNILITGGTGYIGSHTAVRLIENGHTPVIVDNLVNSSAIPIERIEQITGTRPQFYEIDLRNKDALSEVFEQSNVDAVIHFAGLKAVGESADKPLMYYQNNIDSTLTLLDVMSTYDVKKLVFSSSATVYGSAPVPYVESSQTGQGITNPYGQTKHIIEQILADVSTSDPTLEFTSLRYFNPIGAHPSGLMGENPNGIPQNIMPYIEQVAIGKREKLSIFGNDYPTKDGTCRRDYIHVMDLADGHLAALEHLVPGITTYNLGSGEPISVLELVDTFQQATNQKIAYEFAPRRAGDLPEFWADATLAASKLNWVVKQTLENACRDSWNWQSKNPEGYK